ncbi:SPASM domain-containing protein [uncultured Parabacteroides sp.]|uniref:radical SAM/SPASM domain-containing protein n=1 Tax=uncultured Parabacteroides sp. TaxID=512312 RepID=UPI00258BF4EC|nr:SPASM domain-containing protein [uncultured Parabacteroides sp.]
MDTLRTSTYMIPVKLENEIGKYMLIHGYTGAVDIVSEEFITKINLASSDNVFSKSMIQTLLKRGYLTTKTQEEEHAYVARIAKALHRECDILYTTFTWVVTYNCNFRCPYCFEGRDKKDGKNQLAFTKEQVNIAYDAQDKIQPHKKLRKNVITLYGGEPLLAENKAVVNYIVEEGRKRGYTFVAVTNGYEIDHFLNLLAPDSIYKLQITIDGPKRIHDSRRIHHKDHNTFDKIVENVKLALDKKVKVVVRMNSDDRNIEQYTELKNYFSEKGFYSYSKFEFYSAILKDNNSVSPLEHKNLSFLSAQSFFDKQRQQEEKDQDRDSDMYQNIYNALSKKTPITFRSISCAAQANGCVLDPLGNIYPCWEVIGKKKYLKGTYSSEGVTWNHEVLNQWKNTDIGQKKPCNHCKYALLCGGGCPYHNMLGENIQCAIFRKKFSIEVNRAYAKFKINI